MGRVSQEYVGRRKDLRTAGVKMRAKWLGCGSRSYSSRTARHCWDPDCFVASPGKTLSRLSLQGLGKKRIIE